MSEDSNKQWTYGMNRTLLESLRYRHIVHTVECSVPDDISHHLSVGLKYLLPSANNNSLIEEAWSDFIDRLRWSLRFLLTQPQGAQNDEDFDPDYYLKPETRTKAKALDDITEYGI